MTGLGQMVGLSAREISRRAFLRLSLGAIAGGTGFAALAACAEVPYHHHTVNITDIGHFTPGSITIPVGDSIVWYNKDTTPHTATCDPSKAQKPSDVKLPNGAPAWSSAEIPPGQTWSHQFNTPGEYTYFSINEEENGLIGTIVVSS